MKQQLWWDTNCDETCFVIKHRDKLKNLKEHKLRKDINCDKRHFLFFSFLFFSSIGPRQVVKILFPRPIATTEDIKLNYYCCLILSEIRKCSFWGSYKESFLTTTKKLFQTANFDILVLVSFQFWWSLSFYDISDIGNSLFFVTIKFLGHFRFDDS